MIYSIPCLDSNKVYIGETGRTLCTWQSEHRRHLNNGRAEDSAGLHMLLTMTMVSTGRIASFSTKKTTSKGE